MINPRTKKFGPSEADDQSDPDEAGPRIPTPAEAELEAILNELAGGALRGEFRREWPIGDWRVDFYFPAVMLAIEVDGGYHRAQSRWRLDLHKTRDLEERGITVLRLVNAEVFGDRDRLVARLRAAWRSALQKVRRGPTTLREPAPPPYWPAAGVRVALAAGLAATFWMLHASPREFGEPLAAS